METIVYRNADGETVEIGYTGDYLLDGWLGMGPAEVLPITSKGYRQNGYTYQGMTLGCRIITLGIRYVGDYYQKKRHLERVFNPMLGPGTLTYTNDYLGKSITALTTVPPTPADRDGFHSTTVELTAYDPWFTDVADNVKVMSDYKGGLTFPFKFNPSIHFATKGDYATVDITGDADTPLRVEFHGPAVHPRLEMLNTGERIEVETTLLEGEKLWIDTSYGNKTVVHELADGTKESAYHLITTDSSFFWLHRGSNRLAFGSDGGEPQVYLYWRNRYIGV